MADLKLKATGSFKCKGFIMAGAWVCSDNNCNFIKPLENMNQNLMQSFFNKLCLPITVPEPVYSSIQQYVSQSGDHHHHPCLWMTESSQDAPFNTVFTTIKRSWWGQTLDILSEICFFFFWHIQIVSRFILGSLGQQKPRGKPSFGLKCVSNVFLQMNLSPDTQMLLSLCLCCY